MVHIWNWPKVKIKEQILCYNCYNPRQHTSYCPLKKKCAICGNGKHMNIQGCSNKGEHSQHQTAASSSLHAVQLPDSKPHALTGMTSTAMGGHPDVSSSSSHGGQGWNDWKAKRERKEAHPWICPLPGKIMWSPLLVMHIVWSQLQPIVLLVNRVASMQCLFHIV